MAQATHRSNQSTPWKRTWLALRDAPAGPAYESIATALAALLTVAGALKAYQLWVDPYATVAWLGPVVAGEWLLAGWLVSGLALNWARRLAFLAMLIFAGYAITLSLAGRSACGCFGLVPIPPPVTAVIDMVFVIGLSYYRPPRGYRFRWPRGRFSGGIGLTVAAVAMGGVTLGSTVPAVANSKGSDAATAEQKAGETIKTRFAYDFGYVKRGSRYSGALKLTNPTKHPMVIRDYHRECDCIKPDAIPDKIPAEGSAKLKLGFAPPEVKGNYSKAMMLELNHPKVDQLTVAVQARVDEPLRVKDTPVKLSLSRDSDRPRGRLHLVNDGDEPIRILYATADDARLVAKLPKDSEVKPGATLTIPMSWQHNEESRPKRTSVQLHAGHDPQSMVSVSVILPPKEAQNND